jgi:hypothetical protein
MTLNAIPPVRVTNGNTTPPGRPLAPRARDTG